MASLAFRFEEITARELKPELYELDGISRATIEAHYKLYQGYVGKRNEILARLDGVDTTAIAVASPPPSSHVAPAYRSSVMPCEA